MYAVHLHITSLYYVFQSAQLPLFQGLQRCQLFLDICLIVRATRASDFLETEKP